MLMRSYSFAPDLNSQKLNKVFEDYDKYVGEFDYSVELLNAVMDGRISVDKNFNLFGWCKCVREGKFQMELRRLKKEDYLIDDDDDENSGVRASSLVDDKDDYTKLDDKSELDYTVNKIRELQLEIEKDLGLDIIFCMRKAVQGIPAAIEELGKVCKDLPWIGEYVQVILSSGVSFNELFPEEVTNFYEPRRQETMMNKAC